MKIFVGDTVNLILETEKDLSTFTAFRIKYEKPDGTDGEWNASICPASNTCLRATIVFTTDGVWRVQAYVRKTGARHHGAWVDIKVYEALYVAPTTVAPTTVAPTTGVPTTSVPTTPVPTTSP